MNSEREIRQEFNFNWIVYVPCCRCCYCCRFSQLISLRSQPVWAQRIRRSERARADRHCGWRRRRRWRRRSAALPLRVHSQFLIHN